MGALVAKVFIFAIIFNGCNSQLDFYLQKRRPPSRTCNYLHALVRVPRTAPSPSNIKTLICRCSDFLHRRPLCKKKKRVAGVGPNAVAQALASLEGTVVDAEEGTSWTLKVGLRMFDALRAGTVSPSPAAHAVGTF